MYTFLIHTVILVFKLCVKTILNGVPASRIQLRFVSLRCYHSWLDMHTLSLRLTGVGLTRSRLELRLHHLVVSSWDLERTTHRLRVLKLLLSLRCLTRVAACYPLVMILMVLSAPLRALSLACSDFVLLRAPHLLSVFLEAISC